MEKLNQYNDYCSLVSKLNSKVDELKEATKKADRLKFEVGSLKKDISDMAEELNLTQSTISHLNMMQIKQCLDAPIMLANGGGITDSPIKDFKGSAEYARLTNLEKELFNKAEPSLSVSEYNLQNAIMLAQDKNEDVDVTELITIRDYVDGIIANLDDYESLPFEEIKKIKEIIYIFVEQVSKT